MDFQAFSKIPRLSREIIITEKIDGTNAQILLYSTHSSYNGEFLPYILHQYEPYNEYGDRLVLMAGSRTRWIKPGEDNAGFAQWVLENKIELLNLGKGRHFGEWWGRKIQRGYELDHKRFSLFNTSVWNCDFNSDTNDGKSTICTEVPICHVVPVLYRGMFNTDSIENTLEILKNYGSKAAPGYMKPEGIVIYHVAGGYMFKKTIENDESPKGLVK